MLRIAQEFHLVDLDFYRSRPDLVRTGRSLFPIQRHELPKERLELCLREMSGKFPFEKCEIAIDQNALQMEKMKEVALKHGFICLFHEKPFKKEHGSGKVCEWTLYTDGGQNLFDPKGDRLIFNLLLTSLHRAIHECGALLWATVASPGNDNRLFFPPLIHLSCGEALIGQQESLDQKAFAFFTGSSIQFQGIGASADPTLFFTAIHAACANSLELMLDEWEEALGDKKLNEEGLWRSALPVLQKPLLNHESLLPLRKSFYAYGQLTEKKSFRIFEGIFSESELQRIYETKVEEYVQIKEREANVAAELFKIEEIKMIQAKLNDLGYEAKGRVYCELIEPKMEELR